MAEGTSPETEGKDLPYYVKQLSIDNSFVKTLHVYRDSGGTAHESQRGARKVESDEANIPEFLENKEWSRVSNTLFIHNVASLLPGREIYKGIKIHANRRTQDVIVKLIHTGEQHLRELDCLLKLTGHQNVVTVLESGTCEGVVPRIYIGMEQCRQNLNEYVEKNEFRLEKATSFFWQLISAIAYIHHNEIAHRDLKPSNILISFDGNTLKVSDFGISKAIPSGQRSVTVTHPRAGTEGFKPPETYQCAKLSYKADIFPLAINGYYIFTHGRHPYGSEDYKWQTNIVEKSEPDLSKLPQFPDPDQLTKLCKLLRRMLQHSPDDRPTAEQVLQDTFFQGQNVGTSRVPRNAEECSAQSEITESPSLQVTKISKEIDVSGILRKYDGILEPHEATKLSDSLALATEMLREEKLQEAVSTVKDSIPEDLTALDVKDFAFMLKKEGNYIYAMLMYRVSNEIFKLCDAVQPDHTLKWFQELVIGIRCSASPLIKESEGVSRNIAASCGIEFINHIIEDVRKIKAVSELELDRKVLSEARSIVSVSRISIDSERYQYGIDISKQGLKSMETQFGKQSQDHKYYGQLLNNIGEALMSSDDYNSALNYFHRALEAKTVAKYDSKMMRRRDMKFTRNNLTICQEKLGNI